MRVTALLVTAIAALSPARLVAQAGFEGVVTMSGEIIQGKPSETRMYIKGSRFRIERDVPPMGRMILLVDERGVITQVMEALRRYSVGGTSHATLKYAATGKTETILGYSCAWYTVTGGSPNDRACITTALGFVGFGPGGPIGAASQAELKAQFGHGFMVLKTVRSNGGVRAVVTRIERTPVSDAQFAVPAGYTEIRGAGLVVPPRP